MIALANVRQSWALSNVLDIWVPFSHSLWVSIDHKMVWRSEITLEHRLLVNSTVAKALIKVRFQEWSLWILWRKIDISLAHHSFFWVLDCAHQIALVVISVVYEWWGILIRFGLSQLLWLFLMILINLLLLFLGGPLLLRLYDFIMLLLFVGCLLLLSWKHVANSLVVIDLVYVLLMI